MRVTWRIARLLTICAALVLGACTIEPQPIQLGAEECSHCRMAISDRQFASQALTTRGKAFNFDAIECMASWVNDAADGSGPELHSLWVSDFAASESWLAVEDAVFLRSEQIRSPMALGLTAHGSAEAARSYQTEFGGEMLSWTEVLRVVERQGGHEHHHHARN